MTFTPFILASILVYGWVLEPRGVSAAVPAIVVVALTAWSGLRSRDTGFSWTSFGPAARATTLFTVPAVLVILGCGAALGTLHYRQSMVGELPALVGWGGAQQWVLQTVVLREVRRLMPPHASVLTAASLFALVHLPNPVLAAMTLVGGLGWTAIYFRHPNIVPLAVSQAAGTLALLCAFDDEVTGRLRIGHAYLRFCCMGT
jgi:membrane protease YdiL (CAAX protease family)